MCLVIYELEQIIEVGLVLQVEGWNIIGFVLCNQVGGGNLICFCQIWDEYQVLQSMVVIEFVVELLVEVVEEVKVVFVVLFECIIQLVIELNDKVVWVVECWVVEVMCVVGEQIVQVEWELVDVVQIVDDLEEKLDELQDRYDSLMLVLELECLLCQQYDVEMVQLKECFVVVEENICQ